MHCVPVCLSLLILCPTLLFSVISQTGLLEAKWQPGLLENAEIITVCFWIIAPPPFYSVAPHSRTLLRIQRFFQVELSDEDEELGFDLVGTSEAHLRSDRQPPGVYIAAVFAGGAAALDGRIRRGMQLLVCQPGRSVFILSVLL